MTSAESERWQARVQVLPVVVSVCYQNTLIFGFLLKSQPIRYSLDITRINKSHIAVAVTNKGGFPVVVDVRVGNGNIFDAVGQINQSIIVILKTNQSDKFYCLGEGLWYLVMISVAGNINVVDPNI